MTPEMLLNCDFPLTTPPKFPIFFSSIKCNAKGGFLRVRFMVL